MAVPGCILRCMQLWDALAIRVGEERVSKLSTIFISSSGITHRAVIELESPVVSHFPGSYISSTVNVSP
eukprot:5030751-Pleurochrysis_carterae.AAC.1